MHIPSKEKMHNIRCFDETEYMFLLIEDDELLVSNTIKKEFNNDTTWKQWKLSKNANKIS